MTKLLCIRKENAEESRTFSPGIFFTENAFGIVYWYCCFLFHRLMNSKRY